MICNALSVLPRGKTNVMGKRTPVAGDIVDLPAISRRTGQQPQGSVPEGLSASQVLPLFHKQAAGWEMPAVHGRRALAVTALGTP